MAPSNPPKKPEANSVDADSLVPGEDTQGNPTSNPETTSNSQTHNKTSKRSSWYNRTWPRKSAPITQIARESISSASNTASEVASSVKNSAKAKTNRSPSLQLTLGKAKSSRSSLADATTTKVNAVSKESISSPPKSIPENDAELQGERDDIQVSHMERDHEGDRKDANFNQVEGPKPDEAKDRKPLQTDGTSTPKTANGGVGWLGWFSKSTGEPEKHPNSAPPSLRSPDPPLPPQDAAPSPSAPANDERELPPVPGEARPVSSKRSWLQMFSGASPTEGDGSTKDDHDKSSNPKPEKPLATTPISTRSYIAAESQMPSAEPSAGPSAPPTLSGDGSKSSGWVFWSRERKTASSSTVSNEPHVGEIAVSDTPSQKRPKRASISLENPKSTTASKELPTLVAKGSGTAKARDVSGLQLKDNRPATPIQGASEVDKEGVATPTSAKLPAQEAGASRQLHKSVPNLILPSFSETFTHEEPQGLLQLLGRLLNYSKSSEDKHLHRVKEVPKLKSALAIGVHGYFPAPLIRTVLGQPTGTSIKFADMAAKAIRKWTESRGYSCEVKSAALEGEGRIAERVDLLWKLLLNWIDEIRKADFVMIACHSQGVPVTIMLVARLVSFGCVSSAKVGICAMAGINLGPFESYKSRWIGGSAGELFEFANGSSIVSKDYLAAVETVLKFGVRLVYVGSIDDQLVSLESSTFSPISHPHIYRAVFVDGRIHAANFLVHLVGFALKLRNLGVHDHGLIRELSGPLAGSLYTGEGHSRIYEDEAVYDLAVESALETSALLNAPLSQKPSATPSSNPYILPWAVRGILEEDFVKSDLREEANELLKQFDEWKPTTRVLKDVKFRLEGIRSKL